MNMFRTGLVAAAIATAAGGCAANTQQVSSTVARGAECAELEGLEQQVAQMFDLARVRQVGPLYTPRFSAGGLEAEGDELVGAELYVNAQPGVSQPYLERVLSCHAASAAADHPHDPLRTPNIRDLAVRVHGHQFVIAITGADPGAGRAIWEKARALVHARGSVDVQQLSAADDASPAF